MAPLVLGPEGHFVADDHPADYRPRCQLARLFSASVLDLRPEILDLTPDIV